MKALLDFLIALFSRKTPQPQPDPTTNEQPVDAFPFTSEQIERAIIASGADPGNVNVPATAAAIRAAGLRYGVTDIMSIAHLIPQLSHESGGFKYTREIWKNTPAQLRYEGNRALGNTEPGDGRRFAGIGWAQLTGRWNQMAYCAYRGISIDNLHASADDPYTNADMALWYIVVNRPGFRAAAAINDTLAVSIAVNGKNRDTGLPNGLEDRQKRTRAVFQALGL